MDCLKLFNETLKQEHTQAIVKAENSDNVSVVETEVKLMREQLATLSST